MGGTRQQKEEYFAKLREYLEQYKSIFVVGVDNVSSQQMHEIRKALRGKAVVLMGKNTMVRRAIRGVLHELPDFEKILPFVKGNVGFIFTNEKLTDIRDLIVANKVQAPARAGAFSDADIFIPAINTGMEPGKTSFFQALGVPTKITRGTIEITTEVLVVKAGTKVGPSEATLLNMLNISPFTYGMTVVQVYDEGQAFPSSVLDITDEELIEQFIKAINVIAQISLGASYPTLPSVSHNIVNHYKNVLAVSVATDYTFKGSEEIKERLANPEAYAVAAPVETAKEDAPAAKEEEDEESEEESDDEGFGGLFD
ncbi:60S ribosomal protein uL10 ASCRUDRAFT_73391 [Ascoidea rubescens DSM 1968]|uniref:60S acidic ribosomal protein P0 n=1 Tax=Ascoidea rubescens DSM 1968 TaxID=1344418 RepID=A0A1D2VPN0_9ASCO|nr:hypothetical protein ASCRUDRAFT_73391 [Ascoidea rubescens DSM 1968]ODV63570.1 hypothetical protein ASCRUDRAFT_73391 [Ascoidea rubescens DSM 1968]